MPRAEVCITGIGPTTSLGHDYATLAHHLLAGTPGVHLVERFPLIEHPSQVGAVVHPVPRPDCIDEATFATLNRRDQAISFCCWSALRDAGLWEERHKLRIGLSIGIAADWGNRWEEDRIAGGKFLHEVQRGTADVELRVQRLLNIHGPRMTMSAACASGNFALMMGRYWLEQDWCDICLAGGLDMTLTPMTLAAFGNLRALTRRNHEPEKASRPFDIDRDGFVLGEGGSMFVLERREHATRRGVPLRARIAGCGASSDAFHMVIPSSDPAPASQAMRNALRDAEMQPTDIDYVNAHATSTPVGDIAEANVLRNVFGNHVERMPVSSTKGMTGHLLTGAAAVEAIACIVAIEQHRIPPTINLDNIDPQCPLFHVPNQAIAHRVRTTVSNSFGFGGSNTCVILTAA